jgi:hypothetical protein
MDKYNLPLSRNLTHNTGIKKASSVANLKKSALKEKQTNRKNNRYILVLVLIRMPFN